ncbi:BrnA antitoxin family protein [Simplicispira psychrophila]|uniref:BrnA antitoxin family protein n=1 Tax=Simplicispira psychrophila TaxID=80882 RepID=UPI000483CCB6|nr:BrnA antitoxin family protein [Simplicispira psychrophila]
MTESKNTSASWVDPDDAPDLSQADLSQAVWHVAGREVSPEVGQQAMRRAARGRPVGSVKADTKQAVTVRYSPDVLAAFRAMGSGWQAKMDDALREWLRTHNAI